MDLFDKITTVLSLLFNIISPFISSQKDDTPPTQNKNDIVAVDSTIYIDSDKSPTTSAYSTIEEDNHLFKSQILYYLVLAIFFLIIALSFVYGWNTINIFPVSNVSLLSRLNKVIDVMYFSVFNTTKFSIFFICILCIGLIYKNIKNPSVPYRPLHIITYSFLFLSALGDGISLFHTKYTAFLPMNKTSDNRTTSFIQYFFHSSALQSVLIFLHLLAIFIFILKLSRQCIFAQSTFPSLRIKFMHIMDCIIAPFIFLIFIFLSFLT